MHTESKGLQLTSPSFPSSSSSALRSQIGSRCSLSWPASKAGSQQHSADRRTKICMESVCKPSKRSLRTSRDGAADLVLLRTQALGWEAMCSPNEDLRAAVLSWPGQMWGKGVHILHPCGADIKHVRAIYEAEAGKTTTTTTTAQTSTLAKRARRTQQSHKPGPCLTHAHTHTHNTRACVCACGYKLHTKACWLSSREGAVMLTEVRKMIYKAI